MKQLYSMNENIRRKSSFVRVVHSMKPRRLQTKMKPTHYKECGLIKVIIDLCAISVDYRGPTHLFLVRHALRPTSYSGREATP